MENGDLRVSAELMQKLADLLGVTPAWFLQESPKIDWIGYRKASRMTAVDRDHIEAIAVVVVEHHLRLNQLLKRDYPVSEAGIPVATGEDAERAAVEVRNRLGLGRLPIHSMAGLFEETGGIIVECSCPGKQFDGRAGTVAGRPVVVLDADRSDDRKRFSLAHELGHIVMDVGDADKKTQEKLAHRFAGAFLVPGEVVHRELGHARRSLPLNELMMLKRTYGLSMQAFARRAFDLGIIGAEAFRSFSIQMSRQGYRRREPVEYVGQERATVLQRLVLRALNENLISDRRAREICPDLELRGVPSEPGRLSDQTRYLLSLTPQERQEVMLKFADARRLYESDPEVVPDDCLSEDDFDDQPESRHQPAPGRDLDGQHGPYGGT